MSVTGTVMRCYGSGSGGSRMPSGAPAPVGMYLKVYDPLAHDGRGMAEFTDELQDALVFPDVEFAYKAWSYVPENRPLREDGQPNKPLTAFTMEFLPVLLDADGNISIVERERNQS